MLGEFILGLIFGAWCILCVYDIWYTGKCTKEIRDDTREMRKRTEETKECTARLIANTERVFGPRDSSRCQPQLPK